MKIILTFIAVICIVLLISAEKPQIKPEQPSGVFIEEFTSFSHARKVVFEKRSQGWILKEFDHEINGYVGGDRTVVVMEKY